MPKSNTQFREVKRVEAESSDFKVMSLHSGFVRNKKLVSVLNNTKSIPVSDASSMVGVFVRKTIATSRKKHRTKSLDKKDW